MEMPVASTAELELREIGYNSSGSSPVRTEEYSFSLKMS